MESNQFGAVTLYFNIETRSDSFPFFQKSNVDIYESHGKIQGHILKQDRWELIPQLAMRLPFFEGREDLLRTLLVSLTGPSYTPDHLLFSALLQ